jgi:hypothetical protein
MPVRLHFPYPLGWGAIAAEGNHELQHNLGNLIPRCRLESIFEGEEINHFVASNKAKMFLQELSRPKSDNATISDFFSSGGGREP